MTVTHPLMPDLTELSDTELTKKIGDLYKKLASASMSRNREVILQLQMFLEAYRGEQLRRMTEKKDDDDEGGYDFDKYLNVET